MLFSKGAFAAAFAFAAALGAFAATFSKAAAGLFFASVFGVGLCPSPPCCLATETNGFPKPASSGCSGSACTKAVQEELSDSAFTKAWQEELSFLLGAVEHLRQA